MMLQGPPAPGSGPVAASWQRRDDFRVDLPVAFQNPEDNRFTPSLTPFLPTNTAPAERGFIDFNLAGEG